MSSKPAQTFQKTPAEARVDKSEEEEHHVPDWMSFDKHSETKTLVATEISGHIPTWLSGNLYRNGGGIFHVGNQALRHLFDGFAVIHRFSFRDGDVRYQSRVLDSDTWVRSSKANRLVSNQFATSAYPDPCKSFFETTMSYFLRVVKATESDNTNVNIVKHGDKLYAITDSTILNEIDPDELVKKSKRDLKDTIAVHLATAHPHFDAEGTMYNLSTSFKPNAAYGIVAIPAKHADGGDSDGVDDDDNNAFEKASLLVTVPSRFKFQISYNHSFGMTEDHFVILEQSITMSTLKAMTLNWRSNGVASIFTKFPKEKMVLHVIRRSDNQQLPTTFVADPGFCFHFINCYEQEGEDGKGGHLVVDMCCYDDLAIMDSLYLKDIVQDGYLAHIPQSTFQRFVLPLGVQEADPDVNLVTVPDSKATAYMVSPGVVHCTPDFITEDKVVMDLPRINYELCNGKKYRYAYGYSLEHADQLLVKVDTAQRKAVYWREAGYVPGEPVFVARPGAQAEDDGVVLSAVLSELPHTPSFLLVLDAHTFQELGRALAPRDVKMAMSFHGSFVPDAK